MTDTDIAALVERLRKEADELQSVACAKAADALEALQAELAAASEIIRIENERSNIVSARVADARNNALEESAQVVETWAQDHLTIQPSFAGIAKAIRALVGDKPKAEAAPHKD